MFSFLLYFSNWIQSYMYVNVVSPGNRQKKAKAMIEASGLKMIAVEDFDLAAKTVHIGCCACFMAGVRSKKVMQQLGTLA